MRFLFLLAAGILATVVTAAPASTPKNGQVVSKCDPNTELGKIQCFGEDGFITCTRRGNIFRPCGGGLSCEGDNICDVSP